MLYLIIIKLVEAILETFSNKNIINNDIASTAIVTSGAVVAAAAKAAAALLLLQIQYESVEFNSENNGIIRIPVRLVPHPENPAIREFAVIMNGIHCDGLNGISEIHVSVERVRRLSDIPDNVHIRPEYINLYLHGGVGISINWVKNEYGPAGYYSFDKEARDIIFQTVADVSHVADVMPLLMIKVHTVSFQNNTNENVISGAGGFITPISQNDILMEISDSIKEQYDKGIRNVLAIPGNAGQKYIQDTLHMSLAHSIKCRNHIGNAIDLASDIGVENFLLVGNASKIIRLAAGIMDTHTWIADGRREVLALHTVLAGGTVSQARIIQQIATTDHMLDKLTEWGLRDKVMAGVCSRISFYVRNRICGKKMHFGVIPVHQEYGILGQTPEISKVLAAVSREQFALSIKK